jgi:hypothetical protein
MQAEARPRKAESVDRLIDTMVEAPFYIPSTGPSARPRRTLKHADTFAVFDSHGDMGASAGGPDGLFNHDTRYLSRFELLIDGMQPLLLGSSVRDDNLMLAADLTNADIFYDGHIVLPRDTLHIVRTAYLWKGVVHQRIAVGNHGEAPVASSFAILPVKPKCTTVRVTTPVGGSHAGRHSSLRLSGAKPIGGDAG